MTPIQLKIEQAVQLYFQTRSQTKDTGHFDNNKEARFWQHPAESIMRTDEGNEDSPLQIYTDGSKSEKGVESVIVIYRYDRNIRTLQFILNKECTNIQAEQLAILKALEAVEDTQTVEK